MRLFENAEGRATVETVGLFRLTENGRIVLANAFGGDAIGIDTALGEVVANGLGALFTEGQVVGVTTALVGVADHVERSLGARLKPRREIVEDDFGILRETGFVIGKVDDGRSHGERL